MIISAKAQSQRVSIIPEPASIREEKGSFRFTNQTQIIADPKDTMLTKTIMLFAGELAVLTNIHLQSSDNKTTLNAIVISLSDNNRIPKEGYVLDIKPEQIHITASTPAGVFYAFESIKQLLPINTKNTKQDSYTIPCSVITDSPQYSYRGMHLDVSRHFFLHHS